MISSDRHRKLTAAALGLLLLIALPTGSALAAAVSLHLKVAKTVKVKQALKITVTGSTAPLQADYLAVLVQKKACPATTKVINFSAANLYNGSFRKTFTTKLPSKGTYHICAYLEHQTTGFPTIARARATVVVKR